MVCGVDKAYSNAFAGSHPVPACVEPFERNGAGPKNRNDETERNQRETESTCMLGGRDTAFAVIDRAMIPLDCSSGRYMQHAKLFLSRDCSSLPDSLSCCQSHALASMLKIRETSHDGEVEIATGFNACNLCRSHRVAPHRA